jgi:hypothetical protein
MRLESTLIERVETFVHHPVFTGSDKSMGLVLDDLETLERSGQIGQATCRRLREMILHSPHIVPGR